MIEDSVQAHEPRFEVLQPIGSGATARVELVRLTAPFAGFPAGSELALKTLAREFAGEPAARAAFREEAEAARAVRDPSLVRVVHEGERDGRPFLLLQYVPGPTLRELLERDGPLSEPRLRPLGAQLARALALLHARGFVHGDVKPENVRLDGEGRAVLLDLGFARAARPGGERASQAGSLAYLSPERIRGESADASSDVFALGIVLYELATGVHPFGRGKPRPHALARGSSGGEIPRRTIEVEGADELLAAISAARHAPPSRFAPGLSPFLDRLLEESLARSGAARPAASELGERLVQGETHPWWRKAIDPDARDERERSPGPAVHALPLVGREQELSCLSELLASVRAGAEARAGVAWIVGPEGSGKWRLGQEFAERARAALDPPLHLETRWSDADESRPGGALLMLLNRWLLLPPGTPPREREVRRLTDLVGPAALRTLLSALDPRGPRSGDRSVPSALAAWLGALAPSRSLLVSLGGLQGAGPVTLSALATVLDSLRRARILFVLSLREDTPAAEPALLALLRERLEHGGGDGPRFLRIELAPLEQAAVDELVAALFHPSVPTRRLSEVLWRRSRGNAGFLTEILRALESRGDVRPESAEDPRWVLAIAPDELPLPRSLDRLIRERFRALEPSERIWLERMSVVGGRLQPEFLVRAFPPTKRSEIDACLASLVRKGWLVPASVRHRFERPALREALYRSLSPGRRRRLHLAAARGLAADGGDTGDVEGTVQRAFHLHAAEEHAELLATVRSCLGPFQRRVSALLLFTLARWGLSALEKLAEVPERERIQLELLEVAADAADRLGRRGEERELLDHLSNLDLDPERQPAEGARLYLLHARYAAGTGQFGLARGWLKTAVALAERSGERWLQSQVLRRLAQVQAQVGEFGRARALAQRALKRAEGGNQLALAHLALAHLDVLEDRIESALSRVDSALGVLRRTREPRAGVIAYAELLRGRALRSAGLPRQALGAIQRALRMARRAGERRLEAEALARRGGLLLDMDRPREAQAELREAQLLAEEIEDRRGQVLSSFWLGLLEAEQGEPRAQASLERAVALAREIGFYRAEALGLALQARLERARGELGAAERESARALELSARHGAELADRIAIAGTRAQVLEALGREEESRRVLAELEKRMRASYRRIAARELRAAQRGYAERLLETVLSSAGPRSPRRG